MIQTNYIKKHAEKIIRFVNSINHINKSIHLPVLILLCISAYEIVKIDLQVLAKADPSITELLDNSWTFASIFGSTLIGLLSDRCVRFSWRKPIVLVGMLFSLTTLIVLIFLKPKATSINLLFVVINGFSGTYIGAARAFFLDHYQTNRLISFCTTIIFQCIPWIIFGFLLSKEMITPNSLHYIAIAIIFLAFCCILFLVNDHRKSQEESKHFFTELKDLFIKYNHVRYWSIIGSFFLLATSYQLMPYFGEYTFGSSEEYYLIFILGIGVGLGAFLAPFSESSTMNALKMGYLIGCLLFFTYAFLDWMSIHTGNYYFPQFFQYAIIGGFLWAMSVREFLLKSKLTEDGFLLGFVESIQSLGEFIGSFLISRSFFEKRLNSSFFLWILLVAFALVCLESIIKYIRKKPQLTEL